MSDLKDWAIELTAKEVNALLNLGNIPEAELITRRIIEVYEQRLEHVKERDYDGW